MRALRRRSQPEWRLPSCAGWLGLLVMKASGTVLADVVLLAA
jgi:hypothetical protein